MFRGWDNYFLLIGSAAAALIGLLFVVVTLGGNFDAANRLRGSKIFLTPIVFHFAIVVTVSAISEAPELPAPVVGIAFIIIAALGFTYSMLTIIRMFRAEWENPPDFSDRFFYGIFPGINYLALAAAAGAVWFAPVTAPFAVGAIMLVLLLIGIRNAWDLATFMVHRGAQNTQ